MTAVEAPADRRVVAAHAVSPAEALRRRNRRFGLFSLALAALIGAVFARGVAGLSATFRLEGGVPDLTIPVTPTAIVLAVLVAFIGGIQIARGFKTRTNAIVGVAVGLFVLAFLTWAARDGSLSLAGLLNGAVRAAVPLTLGALSGVLCERAGVINIAIEGQFLAAAFTAAVVASVSASPWIGLLGGMGAGALLGGLLALLSIRYRADQIVVGVVLIVLATGLTSFLLTQVLVGSSLNSPQRFRAFQIPVLGDIPILGPILFQHSVTVYLMLAAVALVQLALFHTRWGLRVRAVGEHPRAADTVGIRVLATRYRAVIIGGLIAGIGGAYFTLDSAASFSREMSAGKGFIALAAMLVGRYTPTGALAAALVFGFADALATSLGILNVGVPSSILLMAPYVATVFVVAGLVGRIRMPAADGQPYTKE